MQEITKIEVEIQFTREVLGTLPADPEVHERFVASKAPDAQSMADELADHSVEDVVEKSMTVFHKTGDGAPYLYDYQVKGFFKDTCGMLRRADGALSAKLKAYKKEIDGLVDVFPEKVPLELPEGGEIGSCQRPLRAQTAQGERVALSNSESLPRGTKARFTLVVKKKSLVPYVAEWLENGVYRGIGQWRNSGKGRFACKAVDKATGEVVVDSFGLAEELGEDIG